MRDRTDFRPDKFSSIAIFFKNCIIGVSQGWEVILDIVRLGKVRFCLFVLPQN